MKGLYSELALPLLAKELIEMAARKRTYVLRVVFAGLLMVGFGFFAKTFLARAVGSPLAALGNGGSIFQALIAFQTVGILLFLPAMAAGQITAEKERDSLALLFLTRLGPWHILIEKYLSALVPIFSLLLLAMPMEAIAYAYGGVTIGMIGRSLYLLALLSLQVGAFALMCSAWCRTTVTAFLATYLLGALVYFFANLIEELLYQILGHRVSSSGWIQWVYYINPLAIRAFHYYTGSFAGLLQATIPAWSSTILFLGLGRLFLMRRAFVKSGNPALSFFQWIDRLLQRLNRFAGNISIKQEKEDLPGAHPIAWREMRKNVLARPRYLMRILVLIEVPLIVFELLIPKPVRTESLALSAAILGTISVLIISVNAANAFVSERVQQTLDLLLSTPLSARQIVGEKARAMRRLLWVAAIPLMTLFLIEWSVKISGLDSSWHRDDSSILYLACSILTVAIYLPLVSWLSLWIGLKAKTRFRASITALAVIVIWSAGPIFGALLFNVNGNDEYWYFLSPIFVPILNEVSELRRMSHNHEWLVAALNFSFYGAILLLIRRRCLSRADLYLRGR